MPLAIEIDKGKLSDFCHRWKITKMFFFGSREVPWTTLETLEALTYYRYVDARLDEIWRVISHDLPPPAHALEMHFSEATP